VASIKSHKKIELRLTRRMKAYSSSCSQTVSLCPAVFTKDWPTMVHSVRLVINNNLGSISHCY